MTTSNDTILLVGHGSREASGNAEILLFAERWRARHPDWRIEVGFIEFADPLLDPALNHAARNSGRVLVLPLILNAAGHVRQDIPSAIQRARKLHPDVQFLYAPHLAPDAGCSWPLLRSARTSGVPPLRQITPRISVGTWASAPKALAGVGVDMGLVADELVQLGQVIRDRIVCVGERRL